MTQPPPYPPYPGPQPTGSDDSLWAILAHLSIFAFPLLGPLVIYLVKRDTSPFVRQHAAEALNFHITLAIASFVSAILVLVLIGIVLLLAISIAGVVFAIIAAIAASNRQPYRYPLSWHLIT